MRVASHGLKLVADHPSRRISRNLGLRGMVGEPLHRVREVHPDCAVSLSLSLSLSRSEVTRWR